MIHPKPPALPARIYRRLLVVYPHPFRADYAGALVQTFQDLQRDAQRQAGYAGLLACWASVLADLAVSAPREHGAEFRRGTAGLQAGSFTPASWAATAAAIVPGLFSLAVSGVVSTNHLLPALGLALCVLLIVAGFLRGRTLAPWSLLCLGVAVGRAANLLLHGAGWLPLSLVGVALGYFSLRRNRVLIGGAPYLVRVAPIAMLIVSLAGVIVRTASTLQAMDVAAGNLLGTWGTLALGNAAFELLSVWLTLAIVLAGLPLAARHGQPACLFVLGLGSVVWSSWIEFTYGLWGSPWAIMMSATWTGLLLVAAPAWVLRARSGGTRLRGLLLPAAMALAIIGLLNSLVRTVPGIFTPLLHILPTGTRQLWLGAGVGTMGTKWLFPMLVGQVVFAAQILLGILLAVSLYDWYARHTQVSAALMEGSSLRSAASDSSGI